MSTLFAANPIQTAEKWVGFADDTASVLPWVLLVVGLFVFLMIVRFVFLFNVKPGHVGVILWRGKISRRNNQPVGWTPVLPMLHQGHSLFVGLQRAHLKDEARTKDQAFVMMEGAVQFRALRTHAEKALFEIDGDVKVLIMDRVLSALRAAVAARMSDTCFEQKEAIAAEVIAQLNTKLANDMGYEVVEIPLATFSPHPDVVKSNNAVQSALRDIDRETANARGIMIREAGKANAEAVAARIRGEGRAEEQANLAVGYREMIRELTGQPSLKLTPDLAVALVQYMRNQDVKAAFAANGGTAVVLPDEGGILSELKQLVPALITHERAEELGKHNENGEASLAEIRAQLPESMKSDEATFMEALKDEANAQIDEMIEKLPRGARFLARRYRQKVASKAKATAV